MKQVSDVRSDLSDMGYDLDTIHAMVSGLVSTSVKLFLYLILFIVVKDRLELPTGI